MYLKILPMKVVMRFGKKGKLSPCYVCRYEILKKIGKVAYELSSPTELTSIHMVFHVSRHKSISVIPSSSFLLKV